VAAAALEETAARPETQFLKGRFVDLFDASLPVLTRVSLTPGKRALLFNLEMLRSRQPAIVAAACRIDREEFAGNILKFRTSGIGSTKAVVVIASRRPPSRVVVSGKTLDTSQYDVEPGILRLRFVNTAHPALVEVRFQ
jgi:hypothetical protein